LQISESGIERTERPWFAYFDEWYLDYLCPILSQFRGKTPGLVPRSSYQYANSLQRQIVLAAPAH
jgi:hypothetical protein